MKAIIFTNNSQHACEQCIHRKYCGQKKSALINNIKRDESRVRMWTRNKKKKMIRIPLPSNCPIWKKEVSNKNYNPSRRDIK